MSRSRQASIFRIAPFLAVSALLSSCNPPSNTSVTESEAEAISTQLSDLQQEMKQLNSELAAVRQAVTEIHRASVTLPAAPPTPAPAITVTLTLDEDDPVLGDPAATVAVVEFTDYQCPFCARYYTQTFPQVKSEYVDTGKIRYIVRDYPLDFHPEARSAAVAANCAGEQGAYWEMRDGLFTQQRQLGAEAYRQISQELGLEPESFADCLTKFEHSAEVGADLDYGAALGITGTPSFFVGRLQDGELVDAKKIIGAQAFSAFAQTIDSFL